jgi:hypothetical protein
MKPVFSRSALTIFIAAAVALFALSFIAASREGSLKRGDGSGPGAYSTSSIGYAGLYDTLNAAGLQVQANASDPAGAAGKRGTLIVAEPIIQLAMSRGVGEAERTLLVLPKWQWKADDKNSAWVSEVRPVSLMDAQTTLALLSTAGATVLRAKAPQRWDVNEFSHSPAMGEIAQLIRPSDAMRVLVGSGDAALLAELETGGRVTWILSDPDVMSNHGLGRGENAAFMAEVISALSARGNEDFRGRRAIVFDETVHGFIAKPDSLLSMMLSFPYAIITILTCASAALFAAAGAGRFGAPLAPRPPAAFGKARLIDNCARLLDYGGHHAVTLKRYARMIVSDAARALHAPDGMDEGKLVEWADRVGESRNVPASCSSIMSGLDRANAPRGADLANLTRAARAAHQWKGEILNGSSVHRKRS